jgi:stringent starvation protein B
MEYVKKDEIFLNLSPWVYYQFNLGNDWIGFQERFSGFPGIIVVPVSHVLAIYARENDQGMSFPLDGDKTSNQSNLSGGGADAPQKAKTQLDDCEVG